MKAKLLTKDKCPNCEMIERIIIDIGLLDSVHFMQAMTEGMDLVKEYSIKSVPALISEGVVYRTFAEIYQFILKQPPKV